LKRPPFRKVAFRGGFLLVLALFTMAPTPPGDVGGCGQAAQPLDAQVFFQHWANIDCEKCTECRFDTERCTAACDATEIQTAFREGCAPLVHDGEVCLHALRAADCDEYEDYVKDSGPLVPTECRFCPPGVAP
jgi:hypothetical protein